MSAAAESAGEPRPTLLKRDVFALTLGIVIGAGIFRTPSLVAAAAGNEAVLLLAWALGGLLSMVGALCYAELVSAYPDVGGDYHFLGRAFGPRLAFLYAWARLTVIQTGSIALLAYVFGDYAAAVLPIGAHGPAIYAAAAVVAIGLVNCAGVRLGAGVQRWLTLVEVAGLGGVILVGLILSPSNPPPVSEAIGEGGAIGLAMVFVLLTYGGWNEAAYCSAELRGSPRRMGWIMVSALGVVTLLYLLANLAFLSALGFAGMARSDAVAADVMQRLVGPGGAAAIALIVAIAALTSANATAITGARSTCAIGRNFDRLRWLGAWHGSRETPLNALVAQSAIALLLVLAGAFARDGFRLAVEYTAPIFWFFFLLVGIGLFVLRRRDPGRPRPFSVPLYPYLPLLFCATSAYMLYASIAHTGLGALVGVAVIAVGGLLLPFLTSSDPKEMKR
jgi:amino acid transporter